MLLIFNLQRRKIYTVSIQYVQYTFSMEESSHTKSSLGVVAFVA
jgi:hypothetical protein